MARKTLLNESEIRKFLKLANIGTVGEDKIQEYGGMMPGDRDVEMEMGDGPEELEVAVGDEPGDAPEGAELDIDADDADLDMDDDGAGDLDVSDREEIMADVVAAVAKALGIEDRVEVEAGEEDAMGDMGLGDEPPGPEAPLDAPEGGEDSLDLAPADLGGEEEEEEEEDEPMMEDEEVELSEEDIVSEVARRVAARLQEENSKEKLVDELAERILNRLTK